MNDEYIPSEGKDHPSENETDAVEGEGESNLSENETDAVEGEGESKLSHRKLLYQELDRLVTQICQHPPGWKRSRLLNQLLTKMNPQCYICVVANRGSNGAGGSVYFAARESFC